MSSNLRPFLWIFLSTSVGAVYKLGEICLETNKQYGIRQTLQIVIRSWMDLAGDTCIYLYIHHKYYCQYNIHIYTYVYMYTPYSHNLLMQAS